MNNLPPPPERNNRLSPSNPVRRPKETPAEKGQKKEKLPVHVTHLAERIKSERFKSTA